MQRLRYPVSPMGPSPVHWEALLHDIPRMACGMWPLARMGVVPFIPTTSPTLSFDTGCLIQQYDSLILTPYSPFRNSPIGAGGYVVTCHQVTVDHLA